LGYGSLGKPNVGVEPDTTVRYDVEILDIQPPIPNDFVKIDGNHDWLISVDEAKAYFDSLGQAIDLEGLWKEEDKDHDGFISWEEFTGPKGGEGPPSDAAKKQGRQKARAATDTMTKPKKQEQTKVNNQQTQTAKRRDDMGTLLRSIDTDNDGKISKIELANTFRSLGQEMTEEFWRESDPDGDGYVSFEEFVGDSSTTATSTSSDEMVESGEEL
jgi:Ca2+-binding EF-hand superfamily protein